MHQGNAEMALDESDSTYLEPSSAVSLLDRAEQWVGSLVANALMGRKEVSAGGNIGGRGKAVEFNDPNNAGQFRMNPFFHMYEVQEMKNSFF